MHARIEHKKSSENDAPIFLLKAKHKPGCGVDVKRIPLKAMYRLFIFLPWCIVDDEAILLGSVVCEVVAPQSVDIVVWLLINMFCALQVRHCTVIM